MLANYDQYRRSFYVDTPASVLSNSTEAAAFSWEPSFTILIPANPLLASDLIETLASLRRQIYRSFSVLVVTPSSPLDGAIETQLVNAAGLKAAVELQGDYALVLDSGDSLSPDALHRFASVLQNRKPALLYGDNDELEIRASGVSRHINPHFKPDFDPDLLLQSPFIGDSFVAPIASLRRALQSGFDLSRESRGALVLELAGPMAGADAEHVQRILHNRSAAAPKVEPSVYASAVRAYLSRARSDVEVIMPQVEAADFKSPRILWPIPKETRAAVIIPTRDRLDLLGPCLASLIAAKARAKVPLEIVVVDNASTSVTTERFLDALDLTGTIKLIEYDAPFNWSAINNHAARSVHADVLIFLNNDTVALSQDWSDELCRQAIRPEIGAVGPRLLYEDGTIQHAGIILSDGRIVHEGAGSRADDGGYLDRRHQVHRTAAVTGACLATRAEIFNKLGGFDEEELAVEANDIDYCLRVRRAGLGVVYDPFCTLYHFESQSRGHTAGKESTRAQAKAELTNLKRRWGSDLGGDRFYNLHFDRRSAPFTRLGPPPTLAKPSNIE
jgi:GT2 family glycosyltransferase